MAALVAVSFFISLIFIVLAITSLFTKKSSKVNNRMEYFLGKSAADSKSATQTQSIANKGVSAKRQNKKNTLSSIAGVQKKILINLAKDRNTRTHQLVKQAAIPLKYEEYVMFRWLAIFLGGALFYLISGALLFLIIGLGLGYFVPNYWLLRLYHKRLYSFNSSLADTINTIVGSLRAGLSFTQSLKTVAEEADGPIKEEMEQLLKELQYGISMENALASLKERMPSDDLELMIHAIMIQRQVGGNLATVLDKIVETIRERNRIQQQIRTLTAQGRLSGMVIGLLPIFLGLAIYLIDSNYLATLVNDPLGITLLLFGTVSAILGFIMINYMTKIEV